MEGEEGGKKEGKRDGRGGSRQGGKEEGCKGREGASRGQNSGFLHPHTDRHYEMRCTNYIFL